MEYINIRKGGLAAVTLRESDELIDVGSQTAKKTLYLLPKTEWL